MLYHLIKKDFILVKKYLPMMIGIPALIPLYVGTRPIGGAALIGFTLSSVYTLFMTVQYIFLKESQSPKALSLLCAAPYPRWLLVGAKYCLVPILHLACCLVFLAESLMVPGLAALPMQAYASVLFADSLFFSIYMPLQYKLGFERVKLLLLLPIIAMSWLFPLLVKLSAQIRWNPLAGIPAWASSIALTAASFAVLAVSALVSIRIFGRKDLA
jgi:hypothetical protein